LNFLAHLILAGDDEDLRLGAMLGDFVRGKEALGAFGPGIRSGIMLHRHIDSFTDSLPSVEALRKEFRPPFRRYAGIIIDLAFDHELVMRWEGYSTGTVQEFDRGVRDLLARHDSVLPARLKVFMRYADQRGLFAAYRDESEILYSLAGIGRRLSHANPLDRVNEIWGDFKPLVSARFESIFGEIQSGVADWLNSKSTITGS